MSRSQRLRGVVATVLMAAGIATAWGQQAAAPRAAEVSLDIPSQPLAGALTELGQQTGLTIMLAAAVKTDAVSPAVVGDYTPDEALRKILGSSGLRAEYLDSKTVSIRTAEASGKDATDKEKGPPKNIPKGDSQPPSVPRNGGGDSGTETNKAAPDATDLQRAKIPEILVRGSREMNVDVQRTEDDVQAYTILTSREIEKSGASNVEDFLKKQLTMNTVVQTNSQTYSSPGGNGATSSINLRGLGTNETLVLVDGRRLAGVSLSGTPIQPDINGIPLSAIERIEILPSSASAIYGGAALGGVVNIVLKRDFSGGVVDATYDSPLDVSAKTRRIDVSYGFTFDRTGTKIMISGSYSDGTPLLVRDRQGLFTSGIDSILENAPKFLFSTASPFSGATTNISSGGAPLVLKNGIPLGSPITYVPANASSSSSILSSLVSNAGKYNTDLSAGNSRLGLLSEFGVVPRVKSLEATVRQDLPWDIQAFAELLTASNASRAVFNPFTGLKIVPAAAPSNPFKQTVRVTFPSFVDSFTTTDSVTQSSTFGVIVPLPHGWSSELDYTWSRNSFSTFGNNQDSSAISAAWLSGALNPFVDTIANPLPLSEYLAPTSYSDDSTLNDVGLRLSGPLVSLPAGPAALTVGIEHRKEGIHNGTFQITYPISTTQSSAEELFGQSQSTASIYVEANVPIVAPSMGFLAVYSLDFQLAGRSERYSVSTGTPYAYLYPQSFVLSNPPQGVRQSIDYTSTNPTIGLKYSPVKNVSIRASYSSAFLPPTPAQLLRNPTPCVSCATVTDRQNGQTYPVSTIAGGNPALRPQTSKDWNLGLIWSPDIGSGRSLRVDVERYWIKQPNYITNPTPNQVVSDPALVTRIVRDPNTGLIDSIDLSSLNATEYKTRGWDARFDYAESTPFGTFSLRGVGTYTQNDLRQYQIGSPFLEYAGYPNDGGEVKLKANGELSWEFRHWTASWMATYYSSYWQIFSSGSPTLLQNGGVSNLTVAAQGSASVPSQIYHDLFIRYAFGVPGAAGSEGGLRRIVSGTSIEVSVTNVLGKRPPFDAFSAPYYYSPYGDPRIRDYRMSISVKF